jgi:hypothetical protein
MAIFLCVPLVWANVYTWTDEKGVKHYSNVAPPESSDEIQQDKEIPLDTAPQQEQKAPPQKTDTGESVQTRTKEKPKPDRKADEKTAEGTADSGLSLGSLPTDQGELVAREKNIVKQLQLELEQDESKRQEFIDREKKRLMQTLEYVRRTPVSQFGSSKNKTRQVGYIQYRLEALLNSPDKYFQYGDSDTD